MIPYNEQSTFLNQDTCNMLHELLYRVESCELPGKQNLCVAGWTVKKTKKAKKPQICQIQYQWLGHLLCHLLNVLWFQLIGRAGYMKMIVFILKTFHPSLWEQDDYLSRKNLTSDYQLQHPSFNRLAVAISIFKWVCTAGFSFFFLVFILFLEDFFFLFFLLFTLPQNPDGIFIHKLFQSCWKWMLF